MIIHICFKQKYVFDNIILYVFNKLSKTLIYIFKDKNSKIATKNIYTSLLYNYKIK